MESSITQSRDVCCCGAKTWALVIGWLQLVFGAIALVFTIIALIYVVQMKRKIEDTQFHAWGPTENYNYSFLSDENLISDTEQTLKLTIITLVVLMIVCAVSVLVGVILVIGVQKKKAGCLMTWIVFQVIMVLFSIGGSIAFIANHGEAGSLVGTVIQTLVAIFCIWVVNVHRKEILEGVGGNGVVYNTLTEAR